MTDKQPTMTELQNEIIRLIDILPAVNLFPPTRNTS